MSVGRTAAHGYWLVKEPVGESWQDVSRPESCKEVSDFSASWVPREAAVLYLSMLIMGSLLYGTKKRPDKKECEVTFCARSVLCFCKVHLGAGEKRLYFFVRVCVREQKRSNGTEKQGNKREDKSGDQLTWLLTGLTNLWRQTVQERQVELKEVYTPTRPRPRGDSFGFELYQGLHLINKLLEKELITKAE